MAPIDRKALARDYKDTARPAGIFAVRNLASGEMLVGPSADLPGMLNRQRFQLESGGHPSRRLQADWDALGADSFAFEVLDTLAVGDDPSADLGDDLDALLELWREKLAESGTPFYRKAGA